MSSRIVRTYEMKNLDKGRDEGFLYRRKWRTVRLEKMEVCENRC